MELFNLLDTGISVFGGTFDVSLNWIGKLIRGLCNLAGTVGVGIILFSLALKIITLPLDVVQRISMRKQNIQMKENQEKMDKLQKQYANDKEKYNQKLMEMQKENGFSACSACLPTILSMVIFIVAINAFNAFAQYSNVENYNSMVNAYNGEMTKYSAVLTEEEYESMVSSVDLGEGKVEMTIKDDDAGVFVYYKVKADKATVDEMTTAQKVEYINEYPDKEYFVNEDRAVSEDAAIAEYVASHGDIPKGEAVRDYLVGKAQDAVVVAYDGEVKQHASFLWIKNIWATDASYKHPVLTASEFKQEAEREEFQVDGAKVKYGSIHQYTNAYNETTYDIVTKKLDGPKSAANGYFILIVLSIGTILLQQIVTQKSQKEQQKYSSVDGQAGSQQKMTMIIMTGMFALFAFMYSSAFSIYMITSNLFSLLSTLVINKIVDSKAEKQAEAATQKKNENHAQERIERAKAEGKKSAEETKNKK